MLAMSDINCIKHLRNNKGLSISEIQKTLGINWRTAKKYADEDQLPIEQQKKKTEKLMDKINLILKTSKAGTMSTSVNDTVSEHMNFYIRDYALFTETEKDSPILKGITENPLVYITLVCFATRKYIEMQ